MRQDHSLNLKLVSLAGWLANRACPLALGLQTITASFSHGHWGPTLRSLYLYSRHLYTDSPSSELSFFKGLISPSVHQSPSGSLNPQCSPRFGIASFRTSSRDTSSTRQFKRDKRPACRPCSDSHLCEPPLPLPDFLFPASCSFYCNYSG